MRDGGWGGGVTIDLRWSIVVSGEGAVSEDIEIEPWAPQDLEEEAALLLVCKLKQLWSSLLMLKGPASALHVILSLL